MGRVSRIWLHMVSQHVGDAITSLLSPVLKCWEIKVHALFIHGEGFLCKLLREPAERGDAERTPWRVIEGQPDKVRHCVVYLYNQVLCTKADRGDEERTP